MSVICVLLYICHCTEEDLELPDLYLLVIIGTNKVQWSLLSGTLILVAGHISLGATQAKKVDKNQLLIT